MKSWLTLKIEPIGKTTSFKAVWVVSQVSSLSLREFFDMKENIRYFKNDLPDGLVLKGDLAIDTEAMGLRISRDRLCMIQICDELGDAYLVHFPEDNYNYDCHNIKKFLLDPSRQKIFHYARFDVAILMAYLEIPYFENVFCTKIASRLTRTYTESHGLKTIVSELLGVSLNKEQQCSNWGASEVSKEQLRYAANDVLYLHRLRNEFKLRLEKLGRMEIAENYFKFLNTVCMSDLMGFEEDLFRHR